MFSGPMFRWEYHAAVRRRRPFVWRAVFAILLGVLGLLLGLAIFEFDAGRASQERMVLAGRSVLILTIVLELLILVFFVPTHVAESIAEERQKDTLSLLLLTRLSPIEIVTTKAVARWYPASNPVLSGLPVLLAAGWAAGLVWESALAAGVLLSCSAFMASLSILASAGRDQVGTARGQAVAWCFGWVIGPPIVSILPVTPGTLWGDLLVEMKTLAALVAPSSPVSLVTDNGWYFHRAGELDLEARVALMIGLQGVFGLLAVLLATTYLKARDKNPNWLDPTRGYRPPCGDDPIFWREYSLPMRKGSGPLIFLRMRYVWILIRAILVSAMTLLGILVLLAVPIGVLVGAIYYGSAAFRELWEYGYGPAGTFEARSRFNMLLRAATGMLALLPTVFVGSMVSARITVERDKKTWDAFLTTPLESREVLRSKALVAVHGLWQTAWPLPILWVVGLACGVISPLGVALAAVDLLLLAWANVALGLYLAVRPGSTTLAAANKAAWWMLIFLVIHTPVIGASLASSREIASFGALDVRVRVGLVLAGLAVPALTGLLARRWTRRVVDRFDEWVGRPVASGRINPP